MGGSSIIGHHMTCFFFPVSRLETIITIIPTMWGPPSDVSWFLSPSNYSYLRTINHSEIGVMFTNLAIKRGPHIVRSFSLLKDLEPPKMEAQ